eukprot:1584334-Amphidinium_carterae.2
MKLLWAFGELAGSCHTCNEERKDMDEFGLSSDHGQWRTYDWQQDDANEVPTDVSMPVQAMMDT